MLNDAAKTGLSFGITSGLITTLGLIVGLHSGTHSRLAVIGGILTIAVADAFSDALGIHVAQESQNHHSTNAIWTSTFATLLAKFVSALTFMVPILLLPMEEAIVASVVWGLLLLSAVSYYVAKERGVSPWPVVGEHVLIALVVVGITHYLGQWIGDAFGVIESDTGVNRFGYGSGPVGVTGFLLTAAAISVCPTHQLVTTGAMRRLDCRHWHRLCVTLSAGRFEPNDLTGGADHVWRDFRISLGNDPAHAAGNSPHLEALRRKNRSSGRRRFVGQDEGSGKKDEG